MIRQATPEDIDFILDMYMRGIRELGEEGNASFMVKKILTSMQLAPCFLLVIDDIIAGMAGLTLARSSHNGVATVSDYMFYVYPKYRSLENLTGLVQESKRFADSHNLPLRLEFVANGDEKLRERLLKMHGFKICSVVGKYG